MPKYIREGDDNKKIINKKPQIPILNINDVLKKPKLKKQKKIKTEKKIEEKVEKVEEKKVEKIEPKVENQPKKVEKKENKKVDLLGGVLKDIHNVIENNYVDRFITDHHSLYNFLTSIPSNTLNPSLK